MTPRELAESAHRTWVRGGIGLVDAFTEAITSAISDQTAALQAALEELARVKQERDGLAAAIKEYRKWYDVCGFKLNDDKALHAACAASTGLDRALKSPAEALAARDKKVAAWVLRAIVKPWWGDSDTKRHLLDIAAEYERGEREVPSA